MKKTLVHMGIGLAVGLVSGKLFKTKTARDLAVGAVAGGLKAKESLDKTVEKLRENTNDLVADAKVKKADDEAKAQAKKEAEKADEEMKDIQKVAEEANNTIHEVRTDGESAE